MNRVHFLLLVLSLLFHTPNCLATPEAEPRPILAGYSGTVVAEHATSESTFEQRNMDKGDSLHEKERLITGPKSWADVRWKDCTLRVWSDSVVEIDEQNRELILKSGVVVFRLSRAKGDQPAAYKIKTKNLVATLKRTTVTVRCTNNYEQVSVLDGTLTVTDMRTQKTICMSPGLVLNMID